MKHMMIVTQGEKWRTQRSINSAAFTSSKLKQMLPYIHQVSLLSIALNNIELVVSAPFCVEQRILEFC